MSSQNILTMIGILLTALSSIVTVVSAPSMNHPPRKLTVATAKLQANADQVHELLHLTQ